MWVTGGLFHLLGGALAGMLVMALATACEKEDSPPGIYPRGTDSDDRGPVDSVGDTDPGGSVEDTCLDGDGDFSCDGEDCDDNNPDVHPGAIEVQSNGVDDDCDGQTDEYDGPGADLDQDSDGYTPSQGDCRDEGEDAAFVNPDAIEDLGDGGVGDEVDNDCDGQTDEIEDDCDCPEVAKEAVDMVRAMGLCQERFVLSAQMNMSTPNAIQGYDTRPRLGNNNCLVARQGCEMAIISTGKVGQPNPNVSMGMGGMLAVPRLNIDPQPEYQGEEATSAPKQESCDRTQIRLRLKVPSNVVGFSFDFVFASAEYDEWINQSYNDTFYAIMEYADLNSGRTTNISFDTNGNEIEVDTNFFENAEHPCDEAGSGWAPAVAQKAGSTGWLRTSWNVKPGDEFKLTFSIHDEGDCLYDSIAFIDNWKWYTKPVVPGTEEIPPPVQ